jgi:hypothetical protein
VKLWSNPLFKKKNRGEMNQALYAHMNNKRKMTKKKKKNQEGED